MNKYSRKPVGESAGATVECPHCGRVERFDDYMTAQAWLFHHIGVEHGDKLPPVEGTGPDP